MPEGVDPFIKPPVLLKDRDVVEVEISKIGRIGKQFCLKSRGRNLRPNTRSLLK